MSETQQAGGPFPPRMTLCVGAVVQRADDVLFVRQTYGEGLTGVWTLPWGFVQGRTPAGVLDPPHVAALRETLEEAGVTAALVGLLGVQNHIDRRTGEPRLYLLYLCRHASGDPMPDGVETDRARYFTLAELDALADPVDAFCLWLARRVLRGEHALIPPAPDNPYAPHVAFL